MKGPAIFLAQFASDDPPFNSIESIAKWASDYGFKGIQIPSWDSRLFDLKLASESKSYCEDLKGKLSKYNIQVTELSTHLQGPVSSVKWKRVKDESVVFPLLCDPDSFYRQMYEENDFDKYIKRGQRRY